jgi:hypothetical protein
MWVEVTLAGSDADVESVGLSVITSEADVERIASFTSISTSISSASTAASASTTARTTAPASALTVMSASERHGDTNAASARAGDGEEEDEGEREGVGVCVCVGVGVVRRMRTCACAWRSAASVWARTAGSGWERRRWRAGRRRDGRRERVVMAVLVSVSVLVRVIVLVLGLVWSARRRRRSIRGEAGDGAPLPLYRA